MGLSDVEFSWLRPLWLLALLLLPAIGWLWRRRHTRETVWQRAVDPHLLPHLLQHVQVRGAWRSSALWLTAAALAIVALAGPSLRQQAAPLWQLEAPLVIALDLSAAMRAADLPPSRLVQARAKLKQLLQQRRSGQVGLLVYSGDAFTVAPITRDARTVIALLDSLSPDIMPVPGQRADRAIEHALRMLRDSGADTGEILLVSDRSDLVAERAAARARAGGVTVSALGVGTLSGAPLSGADGFITGADGQAVLARLDPASLAALATAGGGRYTLLSTDDTDLQTLAVLDPIGKAGARSADQSTTGADAGVIRSDDGYWLLLLLLPLMLLGFRRGWLAVLPLVLALNIALPPAQALAAGWAPGVALAPGSGGPRARVAALAPGEKLKAAARRPHDSRACAVESTDEARSATPASGFSWDALWRRADQRAFAALQRGEHERARELAPDADLKGAAAYRGDDFESAASAWASEDSADAHYNRGNALARGGKLADALKAYDEALARAPGMPDAVANRRAVEDALKQQSQQSSGQGQQDQQQQQQQQQQHQQQQQQQDQQQGQQQQQQQQQQQSQDAQQQAGEQPQDAQSSGAEQQRASDDAQSGEDSKQPNPSGSEGEAQSGSEQNPQPVDSPDSQSQGDTEQRAGDGKDPPEQAADAAAREAAEAAAKQAMQQAMQHALDAQPDGEPTEQRQATPLTPEERAQAEQRQAAEQWLRRVPDDPGALLRRKFELEYRRRLAEGDPQ